MVTTDLGACEWFVWDLRRSNLIDRGQLDQIVGEFIRKSPRAEPPQLAQYLVEQNFLSPFQAERILQGKTQGLVLGPYNLVDAIGAGSMGTVYKAQSKTDNQFYAVKVLPRRSMWNVRLARRQVRAFGGFTHANVVPFVDVGTSGGQHYLVWPLVEGKTLDKIVAEEGRLTPELTAQIGLQIANGLNICHQNGLFHGLLKPSNVMVAPDMSLKILDFGIGSLLVENEGESLVDTMSTANTLTSGLDCASPESIMEPTNRTPAGDQYSLGCVLYYCVTGRYPFPEGSAVEKMMAHQTKSPTPVSELCPEAPQQLIEVIDRLMAKTPEQRFAGTDEVAELLEQIAPPLQSGSPTAAPKPAPKPVIPTLPKTGTTQGLHQPTPAALPTLPSKPAAKPAPQPTPTALPQLPNRNNLGVGPTEFAETPEPEPVLAPVPSDSTRIPGWVPEPKPQPANNNLQTILIAILGLAVIGLLAYTFYLKPNGILP